MRKLPATNTPTTWYQQKFYSINDCSGTAHTIYAFGKGQCETLSTATSQISTITTSGQTVSKNIQAYSDATCSAPIGATIMKGYIAESCYFSSTGSQKLTTPSPSKPINTFTDRLITKGAYSSALCSAGDFNVAIAQVSNFCLPGTGAIDSASYQSQKITYVTLRTTRSPSTLIRLEPRSSERV